MKSVIVVGAGLGGLAAAIRLAHRGFHVTMLEKNEQVGGKMGLWESNGYRFDTGPSLLTMPFILRDLFTSVGRTLEDYLTLVPVDPLCRYFYPDGSELDASSDRTVMRGRIERLSPPDAKNFERFLDHAQSIYEASAAPFLFSGFGSLGPLQLIRMARHLPSVFRLDAFRTLDDAVSSFFQDPRLRQLFNRFATYSGSSPYHAPATLAIIPYIEFGLGGWFVRGGMYNLAEALRRIAEEMGVVIRTRCAVRSILHNRKVTTGVRTMDGRFLEADAVVCNADTLYTYGTLLKDVNHARRHERPDPSLSGFVMLLGLRRGFPRLTHHNIFFSRDYREEFRSLFDRHLPYEDPTLYVSLSCVSNPEDAPRGCTNMFVLVNAPAESPEYHWEKQKDHYRTTVFQALARHGLTDIERDIETERVITPADFSARFNAHRGSIYGTSSNGRMAAFLRPPNRSRELRNLFFAGGSSHPGGGIPLVLLSGKIAAELAEETIA